MFRSFIFFAASASLLAAAGCGRDKKDSPSAARAPDSNATPGETKETDPATNRSGTNFSGRSVKFRCNADECDSGSQYCLASKILGDETLFLTSECRPLPDGCRTKECIEQDALPRFKNTNACNNGQSFSNLNGSITFTCFGPGLRRPIF